MHYRFNQLTAPKLRKQKGFSLVAAFIVIAILMAVIAYFVAGQGLNTSSTSTYSNSARASSIISQGGYLQGGATIMLTSGTTTAASLTFDNAANNGLFNATTGGAQPQVPDLTSIISSPSSLDGFWLYRGNHIQVAGVGTGGDSYGVVLSGLKQAVCEAVNLNLHGSKTIPVPTSTTVTAVKARNAGNVAAPSDTGTGTFVLASADGFQGWDKGCFATTDSTPVYIYYQILVPQ